MAMSHLKDIFLACILVNTTQCMKEDFLQKWIYSLQGSHMKQEALIRKTFVFDSEGYGFNGRFDDGLCQNDKSFTYDSESFFYFGILHDPQKMASFHEVVNPSTDFLAPKYGYMCQAKGCIGTKIFAHIYFHSLQILGDAFPSSFPFKKIAINWLLKT